MKKSAYILFLLIGLGLMACANNRWFGLEQNSPVTEEKRPKTETPLIENQPEATSIPPSPTPYQLRGKVIDERTGNPLSASIVIDKGADPSVPIVTDNKGYFQLFAQTLPFTLQVDLPGYEVYEKLINSLEDIEAGLEIRLLPKVREGFVFAADTQTPLAAVTVTVKAESNSQTVITAETGAYKLYGLVPDNIISFESAEGYLPAEITFADGDDLSILLTPRHIKVKVRDSLTGGPVADSQVTFKQSFSQTSNVEGMANLSHFPQAGHISITKPGYIPATFTYAGEETLEVALIPARVQAVIRDAETGDPLPQTVIYLGHHYARTDEKGLMILDMLPEEPTSLLIKAAGYHRTYAQISQSGVITGNAAAYSEGEGRWLNIKPCLEPLPTDTSPCVDIALEPFQAKAIYVPLHYLRSRNYMLSYLDFIAETELNAIVVDVKGDFGFITWDSEVELVSEIGADEWFSDTWMPLDEFVAEAKARHIYTIARIVVFKDNPLAHSKPELAAVREDGTVWIDGEELAWANPFREEVWDYNIALAQEVADFGFDELNFDYIRFPSDGDVGAIVYEEDNTLESRTTAIREFMTRLSGVLRPYRLFISADVFGLTLWVVPDSDMQIGQRLIDVAPQVDYIAPMVYPSTFGPGNLGYDDPSDEPYKVVYYSQLEAVTKIPPYVKVRPWLQGYWYSLEEMQQLKQAAIDSNAAGWAWWNAGGKYDDELFEKAEEAPGDPTFQEVK